MDGQSARILLNLFTLVQAGFEYLKLEKKAKELIAQGATDEDLDNYFHNLRVATLNEGSEFFKNKQV